MHARFPGSVFGLFVGTRGNAERVAPALVVACAALSVGCAAKTDTVGGETNWLTACDEDSDCDGTTCLCGACSTECTTDSDCDGVADAVCADSDGAALGAQCGASQPPICLPTCSRDNDCSSDQRCMAGTCVLTGSSPGDDDTTDDDDTPGPSRVVPNPTGDCVPTTDGSGIGHSPNATDVYLPDCQSSLTHEYYRVFVQEDDTAYTFPYLGNHPEFQEPCNDDEDPLNAALERYGLCQSEALTPAQVDAVNAMDPADALAFTHFLHERLVFVSGPDGVAPYPRAEDILELCEADEAFRDGVMKERCDFEIASAQSGSRDERGWFHTGEQGEVLADALNELYGITDEDLCTRLRNNASRQLRREIDAARDPCQTDDDCVGIWRSTSCFDNCGGSIAAANAADIEAAKELIEANQCATSARADCGFAPPPCDPSGPPSCIDGLCY